MHTVATLVVICFAGVLALAQGDELAEARRLALERKYSEALATIERVMESEPGNVEARAEHARVLSWAGRYDQALREYGAVLAVDPGNKEAAIGRARVLYWSGRLDQAAASLRREGGPEAPLLLAEIERARGHNDRALAALGQAGPAGAPLRQAILRELRPVLRLGYGLENDRELPQMGPASTIRVARYMAAVEFNVHPDVRMEVASVITQGSTSSPGTAIYGRDALAVATMARIRFRPTHWLELNLGAGEGSTGGAEGGADIDRTRHHHFLYLVHPVVRWRGLRLDFAAVRELGDYTPLAIHNNVIEQRQTIAASYTWRRLKIGGEYWHAGYSLQTPNQSGRRDWQTSASGGVAFLTPVLYRSDRLLLEAGARFEGYVFSPSAALIPAPGFFTPRSYQQYAGTGHLWWRPHRRVEFDVSGLLGAKRFFLFDHSGAHGFDLAGSFAAKVTFNLGRVQPFLAYGYSSAQSAAARTSAEAYKVHVVGVGISIRF